MGGILAIVNPAAGGGRCAKEAAAALQTLRGTLGALEVAQSERPGHASELARAAFARGIRRFVAVGGDGTSFEVVNGLFPEAEGQGVELGFLPMGTGNSFLRDFSSDCGAHALDCLSKGRARPADLLRLEHTLGVIYSMNLLSLGFVAEVCTLTNRRFKRFGEAGYALGVVGTLLRLHPAPLPYALDGGTLETAPLTFVSFCNSRYTGGKMMMAPAAATDSGTVEVVHAGAMGRWSLLGTFPKIFKGTHVDHPAVHTARAKEVRFELEGPVDCMIDGEVLRLHPTRLTVLPGALRVCA